ncbi:MAG: hypoxanthine phosphoribosyltransferase [bacterium]
MAEPDLFEIQPLFSSAEIERRVKELAEKISNDYAGRLPLLVGILKGSWIFLADLVRQLSVPVEIDFMSAYSYGSGMESAGRVKIDLNLRSPIGGRDVLIVEDIVDTGLTLSGILSCLRQRQPKTLRLCVLLDKPERRQVLLEPDYRGFIVPDKFVVGYGLDFDERFRQLPYIGYITERRR